MFFPILFQPNPLSHLICTEATFILSANYDTLFYMHLFLVHIISGEDQFNAQTVKLLFYRTSKVARKKN